MLPARCDVTQRRLTDRTLKALKPSSPGKRYELMDVETRGLGVRVNDKGRKVFILIARYPGKKHPVRRTLGEYDAMTLADAREEVRNWRKMMGNGIDPRVEKERRKHAEARRQENSFASVAEAYFAYIKRQKLRRAGEVERDIRRELVSQWAKRPITDITRHDVVAVVEATIERSTWQAHHVLSYASRLFNWAIERGTYGLESSPCDRMHPSRLIGPKEPRTRILKDVELWALWEAAERMGYPFGSLVQVLMLTGQRRSEVAEARWSEIDLDRNLWSIPAARMKADAVHVVPLTPDVIAILEKLPRFHKGDYLFSTTMGARPVSGFSKTKQRLDKEMLTELDNLEPWVIHDVRRTMRTGLSALPVPDLVRELVIGHGKPGLHKVYDQHAYIDEKRHALELWAARLRDIVTPSPPNVIKLGTRAR
jgi:integrase